MTQGLEAVWRRVSVGEPDACWPYQGALNQWGYGTVRIHGRTMLAHRAAFEAAAGRAAGEMRVCHRCDNPRCCNPAHLFLGTQAENVADCVAKGRFKSNVGENHPKARLTEQQVLEIRRLHASGLRASQIAPRFGIRLGHAVDIINRRIWTHLTEAAA